MSAVGTWEFAVQSVFETNKAYGTTEAWRKARLWQRDCGFDAIKLYKEATNEERAS